MKKSKFLLLLFLIMVGVLNTCYLDSLNNKKTISGVWTINLRQKPNTFSEFSWGKSESVINEALEIDLLADPMTIMLPSLGGPFIISNFDLERDGTYLLEFEFDRGGFNVDYVLHYNIKESNMWIECLGAEPLISVGEKYKYYKISGPN